MFKRAIAGTAVFLFLTGIAHAQLSETEQRIVAAVQQRTPAALELLEKSARINSGTLNPEGVRAVGEIYRAELDALGFKTRWIDMPPAMKRAGHLVATHEAGPGKRVLLLGHLDTVFEKGSSVPLWERQSDRVCGRRSAWMSSWVWLICLSSYRRAIITAGTVRATGCSARASWRWI